MPELPEVETIKRIIEPQIRGHKILHVDVRNEQVIAHPEPAVFLSGLAGKTVTGMSRRGKFLSIDLEGGDKVYLHLRMTGQLLVTPEDYPLEKHTHLIAKLSGGIQMRYIDVRRFGRFWYLKDGEDISITGIDRLGVEPTSRKLTADYLKTAVGKRRLPVKEMLQDQSIVAGVGNIYSDEILYAARIHPEKKCADLTDEEWSRLAVNIPKIIRWSIRANRMTAEEYLAGQGREYRNTPHLKAYGHAGKKCPECGAVFEKITVGGRSSSFCPTCQKGGSGTTEDRGSTSDCAGVTMKLKNVLIVVKDIEASRRFYHDVFGLELLVDNDGNMILTEGLVLQDEKIWKSFLGGDVISKNNSCELYFEEADIEGFVEKLERLYPSVEYVNRLMTHSWGQRVIRFYDLDGNLIEVGTPM